MIKKNTIFFLAIFVILSGSVIVITANIPSINQKSSLAFSYKYNDPSELGPAGSELLSAMATVLGALMIGWGLTLIAISQNYTQESRKWLIIALFTWFIIDTTGSLMHGFEYNAILNLVFLIFGLVAIWIEKPMT